MDMARRPGVEWHAVQIRFSSNALDIGSLNPTSCSIL